MTLQDTGKRDTYATGAQRDPGNGKGRCDLLPARALLRLAKHFEAGAKKYSPNNWRCGLPSWSFLDSGLRHLLKFMAGDRSEDHLAAVLWNIAGYIDQEMRVREGLLNPELMDPAFEEDPYAEPDWPFEGDLDG